MKIMPVKSTTKINGGSVRCDKCGRSFWGIDACRSHIRYAHKRGSYKWFRWGPCSGYTSLSRHYCLIGTGWV